MILDSRDLTTALTATTTTAVEPRKIFDSNLDYPIRSLTVEFLFTYTSNSASPTCRAWLQTSLDGGTTWCDIAASAAWTTTAGSTFLNVTGETAATAATITITDGTLTAGTGINCLLGDLYRVKITTTGTYTVAHLTTAVCFR